MSTFGRRGRRSPGRRRRIRVQSRRGIRGSFVFDTSPSHFVCNHHPQAIPLLYSPFNRQRASRLPRSLRYSASSCKSVFAILFKMYSLSRALFVVHVLGWTLLVLLGTAPFVPLASAVPVPLPMYRDADFASAPNASTSVLAQHVSPGTPSAKRDFIDSIEQLGAVGSNLPRDINTVLGDINILNNYYGQMRVHSANFRRSTTPRLVAVSDAFSGRLAKQPASARSENFQQESADELTGFHTNLLGFQNTLAELGADKGLANYDKSNDVETLLKNMINSVKYMLSDIDDLVYEIPGLGPTLGPSTFCMLSVTRRADPTPSVVYEIKCILDEVLDAVENLTDAIINAITPLLQSLIGDASQTACNSGLALAGICLIP